jgi:hypothetical protein
MTGKCFPGRRFERIANRTGWYRIIRASHVHPDAIVMNRTLVREQAVDPDLARNLAFKKVNRVCIISLLIS